MSLRREDLLFLAEIIFLKRKIDGDYYLGYFTIYIKLISYKLI